MWNDILVSPQDPTTQGKGRRGSTGKQGHGVGQSEGKALRAPSV